MTLIEILVAMFIIVMIMLVLDEHEGTRWAARIMGRTRGVD